MEVRTEELKNREQYLKTPAVSKHFFEVAMQAVLIKIDRNLEIYDRKFPAPSSENHVYPAIDNVEWTSSFWTGMLWLAYEVTGEMKYRHAAEKQLNSFKQRIEARIQVDHHDLGFLYSLSCIAAYKLTGNEEACQIALKAADYLTGRYCEKAGIIQAWGDLSDPAQRGRMIIDCLMNLPLLYWAADQTKDGKFFKIAYNHAKQAAKYIVRENGSTYHTFYMDVETGAPVMGKTRQGYADDSCWSRGQAWGIYGFPLSYIYTHDSTFIDIAKKLTHYFLNRLPEDQICYWDLIFTGGNEERDSSAAAIAVCGLLELAKHLPLSDNNRIIYENAALQILISLAKDYSTKDLEHSTGLLLHAVYAKPDGVGIDECCIWGDYFYLEALVRVFKDWKLYW